MDQSKLTQSRLSPGESGGAGAEAPPWKEVVSRVHCPGGRFAFSLGIVFLLAGILGFVTFGNAPPQKVPVWIPQLGALVFGSFGSLALVYAVRTLLWPVNVQHASREVLPNVPTEPVIREGAVVHGRLTHELVQVEQGWQLRPRGNAWRNDKRLLIGFGVVFSLLFAALLSWIFRLEGMDARSAILLATLGTAVAGGTAFVLIGMIMRTSYHRLSCLTASGNGDLELDLSPEPATENEDPGEGLRWLFLGDASRERLTIPRQQVLAVQLCPWKYACGTSVTFAVQGLLVLAPTEGGDVGRLPLLLTNDCVGAARLMQHLAAALKVPYLFCADATAWQAEKARAKTRQPLRIGGVQS